MLNAIKNSFYFGKLLFNKFQTPRTAPYGGKVIRGNSLRYGRGRKVEMQWEGKERRRKNVNSGHYILPAIPKGSACNSLRPIYWVWTIYIIHCVNLISSRGGVFCNKINLLPEGLIYFSGIWSQDHQWNIKPK